MQTIKPNKNIIFARQVEAERTTKSGIWLTDSAVEKLLQAEVINIGSAVTEYQSGDVILYRDYATTETKLNDDDYVLMCEEDVLGKVISTGGDR